MTSAPGATITTLLRRPLVLVSAVLYALGLIVLLSPVTTGTPSDDRISDGIGAYSRTCGVTLVQAFAAPPPGVEGMSRDSALDCAATARGRVGYGLLLLLVAVPVGACALLTEGRSSSRKELACRGPRRGQEPAVAPRTPWQGASPTFEAMTDKPERTWLMINFGDDMSGITFEAMVRLAASGARVAVTMQSAPSPAAVQLVMVFEDADGPFELVDVVSSRSGWVLEARVGWRSLVADTDEESDWRVLSYVSGALLAAHTERHMPLGLVSSTSLADPV